MQPPLVTGPAISSRKWKLLHYSFSFFLDMPSSTENWLTSHRFTKTVLGSCLHIQCIASRYFICLPFVFDIIKHGHFAICSFFGWSPASLLLAFSSFFLHQLHKHWAMFSALFSSVLAVSNTSSPILS